MAYENNGITGMSLYDKETVVRACVATIRRVEKSRKIFRKNFIAGYIERIERRQKKWWWVFKKTPRRILIRQAIFSYKTSGIFPKCLIGDTIGQSVIDKCNEVLAGAETTSRSEIWLSFETVHAIQLRKVMHH